MGECSESWNSAPTCIFGYCNASVCICNPGFVDDLVVGRYRNCGVPVLAFQALGSISSILLSLAFTYCLFVAVYRTKAKSFSCEIAVTACLGALFMNVAVLMALTSPIFETTFPAAFLVCLGGALFCRVCNLLLVSALRPISKFSRRALHAKKFEFCLLKVIPATLGASLIICVSTGHAIGNDQSISTAVGVAYIVIALATLYEIPFLYHFMSILMTRLQELVEFDKPLGKKSFDQSCSIDRKESESSFSSRDNDPRRGKYSEIAQDDHARVLKEITSFQKRVWILRLTSTSFALLMFVVGFTSGVVQLATGTLPFSFLTYFLIQITFALLCMFLTSFAKRRDKKYQVKSVQPPEAGIHFASTEGNPSSMNPEFDFSVITPKLKTIIEASETSRWSQT